MKQTPPDLLRELFGRPWQAVPMVAAGALWLYFLSINGVIPTFAELRKAGHKPPFEDVAIHSPIKRILRYSRGFPVVALGTGDTIMLELPKGGKEYVQVGDSLAKAVHTRNVTVYRQYSTYTEICLFGMDNDDGYNDLDYAYSGLLKRQRVPHAPLPPRPLAQTFWPLLTKQD